MRLFPRKSTGKSSDGATSDGAMNGGDGAAASDQATEQLAPVAAPMKRGRRGAERRRLRRYRRYREALTLELGVLAFEMHRSGRGDDELLADKVAELDALDREARSIARSLGVPEQPVEVVMPGIAGGCRRCGALLSTEAGYCPDCGASAEDEGSQDADSREEGPQAEESPDSPPGGSGASEAGGSQD